MDILSEEENTGRKIIIENQLESTDHDHLGKLITYASGHDAEIIIWIVRDVREEHRQAIDWLNEHTDESINFFAVKVELWQIGDSPFAPKFQVISRPNDWAKILKKSARESQLTEGRLLQLNFWDQFKEYAQLSNTKLRLRKTYPQHWYDISIGCSKAHIALSINTQKNQIACELYIDNSKELFHGLINHKKEIENELDEQLDWQELPNRKASRIKLIKNAVIEDESNWPDYFKWLKMQAEIFHKVFLKYTREILK